MARDDPDSLQYVSNFRIVHKQFGSIKWLEPVDVTALDLDGKVRISKGSVEVNFDNFQCSEFLKEVYCLSCFIRRNVLSIVDFDIYVLSLFTSRLVVMD